MCDCSSLAFNTTGLLLTYILVFSVSFCVLSRQIRVMTNNPAKYSGLQGYGITIVERVPVQISPNPENLHYLRTKRTKMGHWLDVKEGSQTNGVVEEKEREVSDADRQ